MKMDHDIQFPKVDGITFYLAGGAVRDLIMGKKPKDLDFVMLTDMTFDEVVDTLKADGRFNLYDIRPKFNIILATERVGKKLRQIDLAFPRTEGTYTDGRRPDLTERVDSLELDAFRRDFTINSMFMSEDGEVLDYFHGLGDIELRRIRCVGNPNDRFEEDGLRILRALRFAIKLDFDISTCTKFAIEDCLHLLAEKPQPPEKEGISMDRIRAEINQMFKHDANKTMQFLVGYGILSYLDKRDEPYSFEMRQKE